MVKKKRGIVYFFAGRSLERTLESPSVKVLPSALVLPLILVLVLVLPSRALAWWSLLPS